MKSMANQDLSSDDGTHFFLDFSKLFTCRHCDEKSYKFIAKFLLIIFTPVKIATKTKI